MATPATLNIWLDELSASILNQNFAPKQNQKKLQDAFRRRVKRHSYGRTNQFEVSEKLDGLEEKFQILTLDNLSDALHQRRIELKEYEHHWLPDVLDLFLHLSGDPARNSRLLELYRAPPRIGTPPPLRWKDVLADDPIDRKDLLWRVPDFKDHSDSGYDDEDEFSSVLSSPPSATKPGQQPQGIETTQVDDVLCDEDANEDAARALQEFKSRNIPQPRQMTELQLIRETIFILRRLPSMLLVCEESVYRLNPALSVRDIATATLRHIAERIITIRRDIDRTGQWLAEDSKCVHIAAMKSAAEIIVEQFSAALDKIQGQLISPKEVIAVSIMSIVDAVEDLSLEVQAIAWFLASIEPNGLVSSLEALYRCVSDSQLFGEPRTYRALCSLLLPSLMAYLQPIWRWIAYGEADWEEDFFVKARAAKLELRRTWHEQFTIERTGPARPADFLIGCLDKILSCGKSAAFIHHLQTNLMVTLKPGKNQLQFEASLEPLASDHRIPFAATFESLWHEHISRLLLEHTASLKSLLTTNCGFMQTFDAIGRIYLGQDGLVLNDIEKKIFDRIDRCIDTWNDRFLIAEMLEEAFGGHKTPYLADAITVHSVYTSSRTMQGRRRSVQILGALTFEYNLSWPIANIISNASMNVYQRIALVLMQIRKAKYSLERTGYLCALTVPLGEQASLADQKFSQLLAFTLLNFVNTVYDHLATTTIAPLIKAVRDSMASAMTVDDMLEAHQKYVTLLEFSCLAAPKLKVLRQTLITLLDLCIRFSDLVSNSASAQRDGSDHEARSFRSARSRRRTHHSAAHIVDSDSDDDDELGNAGKDYSYFIVLDDDTTVVKELRKLREQFARQLDFFIAGLRGSGRGGYHVQDLEALADRLTWNARR